MTNLKGTKTEANLMHAFAGESMARNKYTFYAAKAREEGYEQIANLFLETAHNEMNHAKLWFKFLHEGEVADTQTNLRDAAAGEHDEWTDMYARMAKEAKEEGLKLLQNIEEDKVFAQEEETSWICQECGHIHYGKKAPKKCPVCGYDQAHFEIRSVNY